MDKIKATTRTGQQVWVIRATPSEVYAGDLGACLACGSGASGVEPDARRYTCEACGEPKVYGLENLLIAGWLELADGDDEGDDDSA